MSGVPVDILIRSAYGLASLLEDRRDKIHLIIPCLEYFKNSVFICPRSKDHRILVDGTVALHQFKVHSSFSANALCSRHGGVSCRRCSLGRIGCTGDRTGVLGWSPSFVYIRTGRNHTGVLGWSPSFVYIRTGRKEAGVLGWSASFVYIRNGRNFSTACGRTSGWSRRWSGP